MNIEDQVSIANDVDFVSALIDTQKAMPQFMVALMTLPERMKFVELLEKNGFRIDKVKRPQNAQRAHELNHPLDSKGQIIKEEAPEPEPEKPMQNKRMEEKLAKGEAVDLSSCRRTPEGDYILPVFLPNYDYCDAKTEEWIWSIGKKLGTLEMFASTSNKFYQNENFECLWLR